MAKLNHEKRRHDGKPTLSARAEAVRRAAADTLLSTESRMSPQPAKSPRGGRGGFKGYSEDFETFWRLYPRKEGKGSAMRIWQRMSAADRHKAYASLKVQLGYLMEKKTNPKGNYCPHGDTWLRDRRFDDEVETTRPQQAYRPTGVGPGMVPFGKYRGQAIADIAESDPKYLEWMISVADSEPLRSEIGAALGAAARKQRSQAKAERRKLRKLAQCEANALHLQTAPQLGDDELARMNLALEQLGITDITLH
jgi:hypothetical protein